jgi:hypothetical protein
MVAGTRGGCRQHGNAVRWGRRVINRAARQRLLDVAGAVLGVYSSYDGGVIHELVVWVVGDKAA